MSERDSPQVLERNGELSGEKDTVFLSRTVAFEASHRYCDPDLSKEENLRLFGKCYNPHGHGHNYVCEATVAGKVEPSTGMVMDIKGLDDIMKSVINSELDHKFINEDHPYFKDKNPTTENLAIYLWDRLEEKIETCKLFKVRVEEEENLLSEYYGSENKMVYLTRIFDFCAAHRLHSQKLSDEENKELFGKCNNPNGHGHNYRLEVLVKGEIDPKTGMAVDLGYVDSVVEDRIIKRLDHKHLNMDVAEFKDLNPTSENVVMVIWDLLNEQMPRGSLYKIRLWETPKSCFEYLGE